MITDYGFKRLFKFIFYILFAQFITFLCIGFIYADETKTGLTFLNNSTVVITDNQGNDVQLTRNTANYANFNIKQLIISTQYSYKKNVVYELELELSNQYITNNINNFSFIGNNMTCTPLSLQGLNSNYLQIRFTCPANTSVLTIGLSNLSNQNITSGYDIMWRSLYLWQINDTIDLGPIINNQSQNTQDIINNQNTNNQNIINNQNQNTQDIINSQTENQKVCTNIIVDRNNIKTDNKYLNINGGENSNTGFGITDFIELQPTSKIILKVARRGSSVSYCFYDENKTKIECSVLGDNPQVDDEYVIPVGAKYVKFSINKSDNNPQYEITNSCVNGNQAITDSVNGLNNSLNNDDIGDTATDTADFITDFNTNTFGLTSIVTAPLNLIQSLTSKTCSDLQLPLPYLNNKKLILPCMTSIYSQYFGSFFTLYQSITYGIIAYWVCVRIFNLVKDFKNPEHDEIEVMDL